MAQGRSKTTAVAPLVLALLAAMPLQARTQDDLLAPSQPWTVRHEQDFCRLTRPFGPAADPVVLQIDRFAPGGRASLSFAGRRFQPLGWDSRVEAGFASATPQLTQAHGERLTADRTTNLVLGETTLPPPTHKTPRFVIRVAAPLPRPDVVLDLGPMEAALAALAACTADLPWRWGLDPAAQTLLPQRPTPASPPEQWLEPAPDGAAIRYRLTVDDEGSVVGCGVISEGHGGDFLEQACASLRQRARFTPARDAQGRPARSYYVGQVDGATHDAPFTGAPVPMVTNAMSGTG